MVINIACKTKTLSKSISLVFSYDYLCTNYWWLLYYSYYFA